MGSCESRLENCPSKEGKHRLVQFRGRHVCVPCKETVWKTKLCMNYNKCGNNLYYKRWWTEGCSPVTLYKDGINKTMYLCSRCVKVRVDIDDGQPKSRSGYRPLADARVYQIDLH